MRFTFHKQERLCSRKTIEALFAGGGRSMVAFPLRVVYMRGAEGAPTQVLVSVSKRRLRHAVARNRAKRLVREAYRLHKHVLDGLEPLTLAFLWLSTDIPSQREVAERVAKLLQRVREDVEERAL